MLYAHNSLPYAVHGFFRDCNTNVAACTCAVAVKVEDDVVVIDRCGPLKDRTGFRPLTVELFRNGEINPGLKIQEYNQGSQYQVRCIVQYCYVIFPYFHFVSKSVNLCSYKIKLFFFSFIN